MNVIDNQSILSRFGHWILSTEFHALWVLDGVCLLALIVIWIGTKMRSPLFKRLINLGCFAGLVIFAMAAYWGIENAYLETIILQGSMYRSEMYVKQLSDIFILFHQKYGQWPAEPGPIGNDCWVELMGISEAKINTQHINFFHETHTNMMLDDFFGRPFYFRLEKIDGQEHYVIELADPVSRSR